MFRHKQGLDELLIFIAFVLIALTGCDNPENKTKNDKYSVSGIVKSVVPVGATNYRSTVLVEFEDGRIVNLNYDISVFTIQKGKYNVFHFNRCAEIVAIEIVQAEVSFP